MTPSPRQSAPRRSRCSRTCQRSQGEGASSGPYSNFGRIEGVSHALDIGTGQPPDRDRQQSIPIHEQGCFSQEFLIGVFRQANNNVDVLMYRPLVLSTASLLDALRAAAERGVQVRALALSPDGSDEVLSQGAALMPAAAVYQPAQLRPQLIEGERRIQGHVAQWNANAQRRLAIRRYTSMIGPHFLRSDSTIYLGFVGLLSGAMPTRFDERVHAEVPLNSKLGQQVMVHFEQTWHNGTAVVV
jgi:hypothetical protein